MSSATVIIPTTGSSALSTAIESVIRQTHTDLQCWVIIDGPQFKDAALDIVKKYESVKVIELPENTGSDGFYGHRIYAAVGYLVNADYILYLDQDNWFDPNHVESMIKHIETNNLDWCYSLRKIFDKNGSYIADDNCESLGKWPAWVNEQAFLVDTSCYCIKKDVITKISGIWYNKWGGDRIFYANLAHHFPKYSCTSKHTLNYRLDGNPGSVNAEFFYQGNTVMQTKYPIKFPWHT